MKAKKGGNFKPITLPEPQTTFARCYSMVDIGTIPNFYQGKRTDDQRHIYVTFELPALLAVFNEEKGEQPFVIGIEFNAVTGGNKGNSNLAKFVAQMRNKPFTIEEQDEFDPAVLVGKSCMMSFFHKRKGSYKGPDLAPGKATNENYNIKESAIMPVPKDMNKPKNMNPYLIWDWDIIAEKGFDKELFEKIPKWLQKKMAESAEFRQYAPKDLNIEAPETEDTQEPETSKTVEGDDW